MDSSNSYDDSTGLGRCQDSPHTPLDLYKGCKTARFGAVSRRQKAARFYIQAREGILVAQARGLTVRTFALTQSDYALGMGLDWDLAVHAFEQKLKRDYGRDIWFAWVEHRVPGSDRLNRHFVECGHDKLDLDDLNDYWLKAFGSLVTWRKKRDGGMVVGSARECGRYLSRYIAGDGFERARFSYNWVFGDWFKFSKWLRVVDGHYPSPEYLAGLVGMSDVERALDSTFGRWLALQSGAVKDKWLRKVLGYSAADKLAIKGYNKKHRVRLRA